MTFEELMKLKEGDRIVATGETWFNAKAGDKGTVVGFSEEGVMINWDNNVNGWGDSSYNIKIGHGEYIGGTKCRMIELLNPSHGHKLIIACEDGKHTNAKYYIDNKLVSKSSTSRYEEYDDFDFKTAVDNCIDRMDFTDKTVTKGRGLIGRIIKKGQRVRIINVEPHRKDEYVCLDEYVGKEGVVDCDCTLREKGFLFSVTFDKKYMNAIDEENGCFYWRWDEIELID
jgi:hypothetical protein